MTHEPQSFDEACDAWEPVLEQPGPQVIDVRQVVYALERAERALRLQADALHVQGDYSAEFPAEDADRMLEAIALLRARPVGDEPRAVVVEIRA